MASGRRFGKYLLHDRIAVGGMGELFLATEVGAARGTPPVVLKILLPEYSADAEYVSMFHDEARIGMQLAHPNVVAVHDLGRVPEGTFLVLEYVHGEDLRSLQFRLEDVDTKFPPETALRIIVEVLHGLDHAHRVKDSRGKPLHLVHRDLSPDNVMISFDGDVKVLDFGIAKADGRATQTQFGMLKGKAQYMSPEQALGESVDARSDVYAVGLVLLELLTGARRFMADTDPVQMIRDARVWLPTPPSESNPALPIELDAIVLKSMQQDPAKRWQSAEDFATALTRTLRGGGVPRSKEHLPALMRRLFPDRAEPFLQAPPPAAAVKKPASRKVSGAVDDVSSDALPSEEELLGVFLSRGEKNKPVPAFKAPREDVTDTAEATVDPAETTQESQAQETTQESTVVGAQALDSERTVVGVRGLQPQPMQQTPATRPAARLGGGAPPRTGDAPAPPPPRKIPALTDRAEISTRIGMSVPEDRTANTRKAAVDADPATRASRPSRPSRPPAKRRSGGSSFLLVGMAFLLVAAGIAIVLRKPIQARLAGIGAGPMETATAAATGEEVAGTEIPAETAVGIAETPGETAVVIAETPEEPVETPIVEKPAPIATPTAVVAATTARPAATKATGAGKGGGRFPGEIVDDEDLPVIPTEASVRILSKPAGMEILIDGRATGKRTPATVNVEPGSRTLSLRAPGYKAWSFSEDFAAGDTLQLQADLKPE